MKKSQLNAISSYYTWKNEQHALAEIERRGLTEEFKKSGKIATRFLQYYRTDEEKAAAAERTKQKTKERRAMLKANGVKTVAELRAKQEAERIARIKQAVARGEYRIAKSGNAVDGNNKVVAYAHELR